MILVKGRRPRTAYDVLDQMRVGTTVTYREDEISCAELMAAARRLKQEKGRKYVVSRRGAPGTATKTTRIR